jgi:hypothetical protein
MQGTYHSGIASLDNAPAETIIGAMVGPRHQTVLGLLDRVN